MEEKIEKLNQEIILLKKRIELLEKKEKSKKIRSIIGIIIITLIVIFSIIYAYEFYGMVIDLVNQI